jgi:hypothetical protein
MTPKSYFDEVWNRCGLFTALHGFITNNVTVALQPDELLRAEWAARVSALDLYIHELVSQNLLKIFEGTRAPGPGFGRFQISSDALMRIQGTAIVAERNTAFDLEVRTRLSRVTYQYPDDIAEGVRLISPCKLWNEVATHLGATAATLSAETESIKKQLSLIVDRRNKIVHEGDLQPTVPRSPWPISRPDVSYVSTFISGIVTAVDQTV